MALGRGSVRGSLAIGVAILCIVVLSETALGAMYTVGGPGGWTYNTKNWPSGRSFRAGDMLLFKYQSPLHNVVAVNKRGYDTCSPSRGSRTYQRGKDAVRLKKGHNYFICSIPGHCSAGMKIDVYAR